MLNPKIPGLPDGWRVVLFRQSINHPRDAVVMCERDFPLPKQRNFVVWSCNMIEGGCSGGFYATSYSEAQFEFSRRTERLN